MEIIFIEETIEFLDTLDKNNRVRLDRVRELFENYGFQVGPKYIKKIKGNLWELRAGKIRIFVFIQKNFAYVVHALYKKTQKLPKREIKLAFKRSLEI